MTDKNTEKDGGQKEGIDSSKIVLDDAARLKKLDDKQLDDVSGGLANTGGICRIQTDPRGCSMNM